jgi:phosphatidylglycerophosphate synthase
MEENLRDRVLGRAVNAVVPKWVHPNHITSLRIILVGAAVVLLLLRQPLELQTDVLVAAALTDTIDGMLARARGQSSRSGAYLDHFSDWLVGGWMGILALANGVLETGTVVIMVVPQAVITVTDRIRTAGLQFRDKKTRLLALAMGPANFQPNSISRLQFVAVLAGFTMMLFSKTENCAGLHRIGLLCLYAEAGLAWLVAIDGLAGVHSMLRRSGPGTRGTAARL